MRGRIRKIRTLLAACGLVSGLTIGLASTIPGSPPAGATRIKAAAGGWTVLGAAGSLPTLNQPAGLAVGGRGNAYVADTGNHCIVEVAPDGRLLARWNNLHLADPPSGIAVAPNGDVFVVGVFTYKDSKLLDQSGSNIVHLSPAGRQLGLIHLGYFGPGSGIAVDASENIAIAYGTRPHVQRYSSSGVLLASWGAPKSALVEWGFASPAFIALDAAGNLYVADTMQNVVNEYGTDGTLLHVWGSPGSYSGQFHHPGGIAVAPNGTIYVSDTENHRIQQLVRAHPLNSSGKRFGLTS